MIKKIKITDLVVLILGIFTLMSALFVSIEKLAGNNSSLFSNDKVKVYQNKSTGITSTMTFYYDKKSDDIVKVITENRINYKDSGYDKKTLKKQIAALETQYQNKKGIKHTSNFKNNELIEKTESNLNDVSKSNKIWLFSENMVNKDGKIKFSQYSKIVESSGYQELKTK
ncbi:MAG: YehR family protein [Lactobacillaceae bacterium]|jgi:uncharacterized lipoprotein YehR (DUF1307 family)|nr:YehR family protein [Lactobacillaceae bacterium]